MISNATSTTTITSTGVPRPGAKKITSTGIATSNLPKFGVASRNVTYTVQHSISNFKFDSATPVIGAPYTIQHGSISFVFKTEVEATEHVQIGIYNMSGAECIIPNLHIKAELVVFSEEHDSFIAFQENSASGTLERGDKAVLVTGPTDHCANVCTEYGGDLKIKISFTFDMPVAPSRPNIPTRSAPTTLSTDFASLLDDENASQDSDVCVYVHRDDEAFDLDTCDCVKLHQLILRVRCPLLLEKITNSKMNGEFPPRSTVLAVGSTAIFHKFIRFVYSDTLDTLEATGDLKDLLKLAAEFELPRLVERCAETLSEKMEVESLDSVCDILVLLDGYEKEDKFKSALQPLKERAMQKAIGQRDEFMLAEGFKKLGADILRCLFAAVPAATSSRELLFKSTSKRLAADTSPAGRESKKGRHQ